ncbi:MAG: flagellar basal body rod protein FlgC [Pirellulales bacterium]|jgi:flagellar basal-body rod protein FlgC|nr:flagellar basal body rod protein FlgC [Pirellulales bacterium]
MFTAINVSTSALVAQRVRLNSISNNIANISTTRNEAGQPEAYQPRYVVFQTDTSLGGPAGAAGVRVSSVETEKGQPRLKYDPTHPDADKNGYVAYPDIDLTTQFVDSLEASRAYEANIGLIEISKDLFQQSFRILA